MEKLPQTVFSRSDCDICGLVHWLALVLVVLYLRSLGGEEIPFVWQDEILFKIHRLSVLCWDLAVSCFFHAIKQ